MNYNKDEEMYSNHGHFMAILDNENTSCEIVDIRPSIWDQAICCNNFEDLLELQGIINEAIQKIYFEKMV